MNVQSTVRPLQVRRARSRQHRTALLVLACLACLGLAVVLAHTLLWLALAAAAGFVGFGWPAFLGLADPTAGEEQ